MKIKPLKEYIREAEQEVIDRPPVLNRPPAEKEKAYDFPGGATVMILNDDKTPGEVVVDAIVAGTGMPASEAFKRMMRAHQGGWAPVASYSSKDMAETVADRIMRHAQRNSNYDHYRQHPHFRNFSGPWPLQAEVMDAKQ
jgi:ATP-dependent Clp protease adapter protein ClpS